MTDSTIASKAGEVGEKIVKEAGKGLKEEFKQTGKALLGQMVGSTQSSENPEMRDEEELKKQQLRKKLHQAAQEMGNTKAESEKPAEEMTDEKEQSQENPPLTPLAQTDSKTPIGMIRHGTKETTKGFE